MSTGNTMRGTPNRGQGRGAIPFQNSPSNSNIPRPVLETHPPGGSEVGGSSLSVSRAKQSKKDEAIRRKMESDLSKKKHLASRARHSRKAPPGTVLALKPSPALQIKPGTTVAEAAQLMAAKREDCVLVTDDDERIAGIFTAKDLAFRVVGAGLKANSVTIAEIMTKNPLCARTDTSATDALDLMVRKGFRHLPVMDENQDISGILDITKCFYDAMEKLERAYASSRKLYDALEGVQSELGTSQPQQIIQYVEALRSKMSGPTLESVLNGMPPTTVSVRTSVKEAAHMMKENHTTAVLVQDGGAITGIFTSKDVVLRVIAPGLDPATCSVVRVMTPHPDFAPMDMSIQAALRKMHDGHYLNLPVMNEGGEIVGMVDVLKLTYATLEQINTMGSNDSEGPAWNKFWLSLDHETESMVSGDGSHHHTHHGPRSLMSPDISRSERLVDSVAPGDSASHVGVDSPAHSAVSPATPEQPPAELPFAFKFKAPSGRVHRIQVVAAHGMAEFVASVTAKLGAEVDAIGGAPVVEDGKLGASGYALSYLDDEGDSVSITTDQDLLEAILLARHSHRDKVDLFVHDPKEPPAVRVAEAAAILSPAPEPVVATPPVSAVVRERRSKTVRDDEDDEEDSEDREDEDASTLRRSRRNRNTSQQQQQKQPEQVIAGVPNELLLPGAIVTLAVVIIGVFAIGRMSSR
ncbi:putative mitochondrial ribosomal protein subunit S4 protein [Diplogelasinospora grovesii]|uniref:Mitochondrial ribosomal protein subunit S4 protein n=1 Tax=Diplogelasinospora grovesii TaxID=303347 RepID=A0AAN6MZK1_9PEZI|nr:putative mitochondrial ribosomal protein subunit S4 protein [Diplogelasinospora grovesii]